MPVPEIDVKDYSLELAIEETTKKVFNLNELKTYPKYSVTSAIMCGGNRRSEMAQVETKIFIIIAEIDFKKKKFLYCRKSH